MCFLLRGRPDTKSTLGCHTRSIPQVAGVRSVRPRPPDSSMPNRALEPWLGATPHFRCPVRASRRVGMCTSRTPPPWGSLPVQQSLAGKALGSRRPRSPPMSRRRQGGVPLVQARAARIARLALGDRRSCVRGDPAARNLPEMPLECPQAVSEPVAEASGLGASSPARRWAAQSCMSGRRRSNSVGSGTVRATKIFSVTGQAPS